jgi:hypothetical protein
MLSGLRRRQSPTPVPAAGEIDEFEDWNRLVAQGWVERWHPRHRRRDWLWVKRVEDELLVFPGSEAGPRRTTGAYYRLNGDLAYRELGHPDGPSSTPWFVIRSGRVYPAEGHPEATRGASRYDVERVRRKGMGPIIRPVGPGDYPRADRS